MNKCPYCGSRHGVYTTFTGMQFYDFNGEPDGYDHEEPENQKKFTKCRNCDRRISLNRIRREAKMDGGSAE